MQTGKIDAIASDLRKSPTKQNWERFSKALKGSGLKYYRITFEKGGKLNKAQDLTKSYAELFDAKEKMVTKVPIFMKEGKKVVGSTIYLMGLIGINRWNS